MEFFPKKDLYDFDIEIAEELFADPYLEQSIHHSQPHIFRRLNKYSRKQEPDEEK